MHTCRMELRQLRYFAAAARLESITGASREFGLSQSALSQQIHKLEAELGLELFARNGRRVKLTAAGKRLLPWADRALDAVQQGLAYARESSLQQFHSVRLGGVPSLDSELIPRALKAFSNLYPEIEVSVIECET